MPALEYSSAPVKHQEALKCTETLPCALYRQKRIFNTLEIMKAHDKGL